MMQDARTTVDDPFDRLSDQEIADACAFADGTLPAVRRAEVEASVYASPELTALVERQKKALTASATLADERPPASLLHSVDGLRPASTGDPARLPALRRRRRWGFALSAAGLAVAALVVFVVLNVSGGLGRPSVAAAADLALQAPAGPAPAIAASGKLNASVGGISFPDYTAASGWRPVGVRSGEVAGRPATVVYYEKGGRRVGYAIVDGAALPLPDGATSTTRAGVEYLSFERRGQQIVTWRNAGHTCVLAGPVASAELVALASWDGSATY
jgi:hypothetical protein